MTIFTKISPILSVFDKNLHFKHALFSILMLTLLIPYERDKIYSHMILSILKICVSNFLGSFSTFLGAKIFRGRFLFYWGSLQLFGLPFHLIGDMILPFRGSFHFFGGMKILGVLFQKIPFKWGYI